MARSPLIASYKGTCLDTSVRMLEQLKCGICLRQLLSEPVFTSCKHLIRGNRIKDFRMCPKCGNRDFITSPDFVTTGVIDGFKVKCPNSTEGCEWQGELGDVREHWIMICEQTACFLGCGEKMKGGLLMNHIRDHCPNRPFNCPHCGHHGVYKNVTSIHYTTCEEFPLFCPAGCRERIARGDMKSHLLECPSEYIPCKYAMFGCDKNVKRRKRKIHFDDNEYHLKKSLYSQVAIYGAHGKLLTSNTHIKPDLASLPLSFRPWLQNSPTCYSCPPWVVKLEGFEEMKKSDERWFSQPVYSHFGGYKMCLSVYSNGYGPGKGTHVSLNVNLMKGGNDDNLKFPFKGSITVSLLNQEEDSNHLSVGLWSDKNVKDDVGGRVITRERASCGWGLAHFISQEDLDCNSVKNTAYLKSDSLFFRVDKFKPTF